jgi:hypothetical protein
VKTFGIGESALAELVGDLLESPGAGIEAGIYAHDDGVHLRFWTRGPAAALEAPVERARALAGEHVYGTDDDDLAAVALRALAPRGVRSLASVESGTGGALLAILAAAESAPVRYAGGLLLADADDASRPPAADAVLRVRLLPIDAHGRSRVEVSLSGALTLDRLRARVHGSGPQRQRRAAYAVLDQVRRALG